MKSLLKSIPGSITAPQGFHAAGVFCDIKRLGTGKGSNKGRKRDLALIVSTRPASVAGLFTTNQICAAPVKICIPRAARGVAQAIVVNSGNANACTGRQGLLDAREMVRFTERTLALPAGSALVGSTGRIGVALPMDNVRAGILEAAIALGSSPTHAAQVAESIMTSDTRPKEIAVEFSVRGKKIRIGGVCKGAGMIQPGMSLDGSRPAAVPAALHATMLCFITTDAQIAPATLRSALRAAVAASFNRITVDGDMSTNDTVLALANGMSGTPALRLSTPAFRQFQAALSYVCLQLAQMIVRDGEGASRFVTVRVTGAKSFSDADAAARSVANSVLVKTSWHGGDPNWGRIIDALGYSPARIVENKVDIGYSSPGSDRILYSLRAGQPTPTSFAALCKVAAQKEFDLHINLNLGQSRALMYAADLTEAYVDFNKGDVSDPSALGG